MSERLYSKCAGCNGTTKTVTDFRTNRMVSAAHCGKCAGMRKYSAQGADGAWTFAPCPVCANAKSSSELVPLILPVGSNCPLCADGYAFTGITQAQVERLQSDGERLLEFAARVADAAPAGILVTNPRETELLLALAEEARSIVDGKRGRVEEYRRKNPKPPAPYASPA